MKINSYGFIANAFVATLVTSSVLLVSSGCESGSKGTQAVGKTMTDVAMTPMHTLEYNELRMKEAELKQELADLQAENKALEAEKAALFQTNS